MNLSLLLIIILVVGVLPWIIRRAFPHQPQQEVTLIEPQLNEPWDVPEPSSQQAVMQQAPDLALDILGFSPKVDGVLPLTQSGMNKNVAHSQQTLLPTHDQLVIIHVMAKPGALFVGYELLQAIIATGLRHGHMQIFHYYDNEENVLFSLVSAVEPGIFDLEQIGGFSTPGLSFFMNKHAVKNPDQVLSLMLTVAEQLAEDLGGIIKR